MLQKVSGSEKVYVREGGEGIMEVFRRKLLSESAEKIRRETL